MLESQWLSSLWLLSHAVVVVSFNWHCSQQVIVVTYLSHHITMSSNGEIGGAMSVCIVSY